MNTTKSNPYFTGVKSLQDVKSMRTVDGVASSLLVTNLESEHSVMNDIVINNGIINSLQTMKDFLPVKGTGTQVLGSDGVGNFLWVTNGGGGGGITSVVGTTNQITANTVGGTVTISIPSPLDVGTFNTTGSVNVNSGKATIDSVTGNIVSTGTINGTAGLISGTGPTQYTLPVTTGTDGQVIVYGTTTQTSWGTIVASPKLGNTILVDAVNGDDTTGAIGGLPFKTVNAAITAATIPGLDILVLPGTYNLSGGVTVPAGCSLQGVDPITCILDGNTISLENSSLQNISLNITGTGNLVGISVTGNTFVLNVICTITHTGLTGSAYGLVCNGAGALPVDNLVTSIIDVNADNTVTARGVSTNTLGEIVVKNSSITAEGTTSDGIAITTEGTSSAKIYNTIISGITSDVKRIAGNLQIAYCNLIHNTANGTSFSPYGQPAGVIFSVIGTLAANQTYNLVPGSCLLANLPGGTYNFPVSISAPVIITSVGIIFSTAITAGATITLEIFVNTSGTPALTVTLSTGTFIFSESQSVTLTFGDTIYAKVTTVNDPGVGTFNGGITIY